MCFWTVGEILHLKQKKGKFDISIVFSDKLVLYFWLVKNLECSPLDFCVCQCSFKNENFINTYVLPL